jgi:hypothetical protein
MPNLQSYSSKKMNSEMLGLGIDNQCRIVFLSLRQGCGAGARAGVPVPVPADIFGFPKRHMRRPNVPAKYVGPGT